MSTSGIGADVQRVDGIDKVMGRPIFAADRILPNMAHAVPVPATVGKGRVARIDTSAAERIAGVLLVLTHENMDRLNPVGFVFAGGYGIESFEPLQSDAIAYRGQPVALVVAESLEAAWEGAQLVKVAYETAPFTVEPDAPGAETIDQATALPWFHDFVAGDANRALRGASVRVDQVYTTPPEHQNPMELLGTVAEWAGGRLTIHEGTQASQAIQHGLATALGIDPGLVRVMSPYVGGGFGSKNSMCFHTVMAAVAARRLGRPVKLVVPRAQVFYGTSFRPGTRHRIALGADRSGRIVAGVHEARAQTSRFDLMPFLGAETTSRMYGIPNFRGTTTLVRLDTQTPGFMRTPFEMSSFFALESAMDELAYELGMDPVDVRTINDTQVDPISGKPYTVRRLKECLQRGAERFGWARRTPAPMSMRAPGGTLVGWGVAAGAYPTDMVPNVATIRLDADGIADVSVGGHEMGQGLRTAVALVVADELGLELGKIRITVGDTIAQPQHLTAGAWGTASAAPAVQAAAREVRARLIELATSRPSPLADVEPARLALHDGRIEEPGGRGVSITELLRNAGLMYVEGRSERLAPGQDQEAMKRAMNGLVVPGGPDYPDFLAFAYIAHFAEVQVDPRIPRARVSRMVSVVDCGRVVSKRTALSQAYGGLVWGIGGALTEESEVDPRFGGFLNTDLAEYQVPVNADIRHLEIDFIDEPDFRLNSVGAKGVGEIVVAGAAAAIANAIFHATGRRVRDLPIRIDDLLASPSLDGA
ncbi:MAG TPA: xanthine dehydrogenase family protein molybdopterin-binding subunit [Gemmatimonadales bacterium]|nr:xanthine dehydrogenase family protein molybdopterin-binding subunit [Gemmatimonadales bacterium]